MQLNRHSASQEKRQKGGTNFELFYYEQVGSRYYLRFTRFTLILVVGLMVISIVTLLALFLFSDHLDSSKKINLNVTVPESSSPSSNQPVLQPAPPFKPKTNKQSGLSAPSPTPPNLPKANVISNTTTKSNANSNEH